MMDRARRLQPAVQVAHSREDEAAQVLAEARRRLAEQEARLNQLQVYRSEYADQFQNAGRNGLTARQLQNYAAFLTSIDQSIARTRQQLDNLRAECERQQHNWLRHRAKAQAMDTVVENYRREQIRIDDRREQAANDERALQSRRKQPEE